MKPTLILSILALLIVLVGAVLALMALPQVKTMAQYGDWPYYMLGGSVAAVVLLAALYSWLMAYSARHHDHKVFRPDDFEHWRDD